MDYYPGREDDYYKAMGFAEAQQVNRYAASLAHRFIKNHYARSEFLGEIRSFHNDKTRILSLDIRDRDRSIILQQKKQAMADLRAERQYLQEQDHQLSIRHTKQQAIISFEKRGDAWFYVLKGVNMALGAAQVVAGAGLVVIGSPTIMSTFAGVALVVHGASSILESYQHLKDGNSGYTGFMREGYQSGAKALGYNKRIGNILYGGIDMALSGYGVFRYALKPDAKRLYYWMYNDFVRNYKNMSTTTLSLEVVADGITLKAIFDEANKE